MKSSDGQILLWNNDITIQKGLKRVIQDNKIVKNICTSVSVNFIKARPSISIVKHLIISRLWVSFDFSTYKQNKQLNYVLDFGTRNKKFDILIFCLDKHTIYKITLNHTFNHKLIRWIWRYIKDVRSCFLRTFLDRSSISQILHHISFLLVNLGFTMPIKLYQNKKLR